MVADELWSGEGGHPVDNVDEFFASAYGAFVRAPVLLRQIVTHYKKAGPKINGLADQLFPLLSAVGKPKAWRKLREPKKEKDAAQEELSRVKPPLDISDSNPVLGWLVKPSRFVGLHSPEKIICPGSASGPSSTVEAHPKRGGGE
jgi:hypothetical protein